MEIVLVGVILLFLFNYIGAFNFNTFITDNKALFSKLKEDDYDFLLISKYGDQVDVNVKYQSRVKSAIITFIIGLIVAITSVSSINFAVKLVGVFLVTFLVFKNDYNSVKNYYKKHLHDINLKLPYYLKSLEILKKHLIIN